MNIVMKNRGKKREKNFSKNTRIGYPKIVGKKSSQKSAKKMFFYKHMNIVTKNGGKRGKKFSRNTQLSQANNDGKKSSGKSAKTRFL